MAWFLENLSFCTPRTSSFSCPQANLLSMELLLIFGLAVSCFYWFGMEVCSWIKDTHVDCLHLFVAPCHWFQSCILHYVPPCIFKCLHTTTLWTLAVCRCAAVTSWHPLLGCFLCFALNKHAFSTPLLQGLQKGKIKILTEDCKTENATALSKCAKGTWKLSSEFIWYRKQKCSPLDSNLLLKKGGTLFPVCTVVVPSL